MKGKSTRLKFARAVPHHVHAKGILERIHADIQGPFTRDSLGGDKYILMIVDEYSGLKRAIGLKTKGQATDEFMEWLTQASIDRKKKVVEIHTDGGAEFINNKVKKYCANRGIKQTYTVPDTPHNNGTVERGIRTASEGTRCNLCHANASPSWWADSYRQTILVQNQATLKVGSERTPAQLWNGRKDTVSISKFKVWACDAWMHVHGGMQRASWDPKALLVAHLGWIPDRNAWKLIHVPSMKVYYSRDVRFDEGKFTQAKLFREEQDENIEEDEKTDKKFYESICLRGEIELAKRISLEEHTNQTPQHQPSAPNSAAEDQVNSEDDDRVIPRGLEQSDDEAEDELESADSDDSESSGAEDDDEAEADDEEDGGDDEERKESTAPPPRQSKPNKWQTAEPPRRSTRRGNAVHRLGMISPGDMGQRHANVVIVEPEDFDEEDSDDESRLRQEYRNQSRVDQVPGAILPKVKNGGRKMPSQRCTATGKNGKHCRARTAAGEYCYNHLKSLKSLRIKKSEHPQIKGKGLFATADMKKNQVICAYTGEIREGNGDDYEGSDYVFEVSTRVAIDAARTNCAVGRFVNDSRGTAKRVNCKFAIDRRLGTVTLQALRAIKAGEELYITYGAGYWRLKKKQEKDRLKHLERAAIAVEREPIESNPQSLREAFSRPTAAKWREAVNSEIESLLKHKCYEVIDALPPGAKAILTTWVFVVKVNGDGVPVKHKARLCVRGDMQGKDELGNTFAPTLSSEALRTVLADACVNDYEVQTMDITTAFLHGDLKETIYIKPAKEMPGIKEGQYLRLLKTVYGLCQAGCIFIEKLHGLFKEIGWKQCKDSDECMFTKLSRTGRLMKLGNFVDDIIKVYHKDDEKEMQESVDKIGKVFELKDLGNIQGMIGFRITRNRELRTLLMDQESMTTRLLLSTGYDQCNPAKTPGDKIIVPTNSETDPQDREEEKDPRSKHPRIRLADYRTLVGSLQYLSNGSRPDISFAVNSLLARHMANPQVEHLNALKRVFRYLSGTRTMGLLYSASSDDPNHAKLQSYSDSDWAEDKERRSVSGLVFKYAGAPISWSSKRQQTVSLSSTEAEYIASNEAGREVVWLWRLFADLGIPQVAPAILYCDNQSAIRTAVKDGNLDRRKHIDVKHHWIREKLANKEIELKWIPSAENQADILTKPLGTGIFQPLRQQLMGYNGAAL